MFVNALTLKKAKIVLRCQDLKARFCVILQESSVRRFCTFLQLHKRLHMKTLKGKDWDSKKGKIGKAGDTVEIQTGKHRDPNPKKEEIAAT